MLFIEDLIEELYDAMESRPHRADFPAAGTELDGICYEGTQARITPEGKYCWCPVTHKATLGEIVALLQKFRTHPQTLMTPDFTSGCFEKKLYSMYLCYLPAIKPFLTLKYTPMHGEALPN